jgi:hypothetical protein
MKNPVGLPRARQALERIAAHQNLSKSSAPGGLRAQSFPVTFFLNASALPVETGYEIYQLIE